MTDTPDPMPDPGPMSAHGQRVADVSLVLDMSPADLTVAAVAIGLTPGIPDTLPDTLAELAEALGQGDTSDPTWDDPEARALYVQALVTATDDELHALATVARDLRDICPTCHDTWTPGDPACPACGFGPS